jgi:hypothetical protein
MSGLPEMLAAQVPGIRISYEGNPSGPLQGQSTGLLLTIDADKPVVKGSVRIQAPKELGVVVRSPGFDAPAISQDSGANAPVSFVHFPLQATAGIQTFMLDIHWLGGPRRKAQLKLIAQAITEDSATVHADSSSPGDAGAVQRTIAQTAIPIDVVRSVSISRYVVMGLVGVFTGWVLRVLLFAQSQVAKPNPSPDGRPEGRITQFIKNHYYLVDGLLTATLGLIALLALVQDGAPPNTVDSSISAYLIGTALGALTNSELLLKVRR